MRKCVSKYIRIIKKEHSRLKTTCAHSIESNCCVICIRLQPFLYHDKTKPNIFCIQTKYRHVLLKHCSINITAIFPVAHYKVSQCVLKNYSRAFNFSLWIPEECVFLQCSHISCFDYFLLCRGFASALNICCKSSFRQQEGRIKSSHTSGKRNPFDVAPCEGEEQKWLFIFHQDAWLSCVLSSRLTQRRRRCREQWVWHLICRLFNHMRGSAFSPGALFWGWRVATLVLIECEEGPFKDLRKAFGGEVRERQWQIVCRSFASHVSWKS